MGTCPLHHDPRPLVSSFASTKAKGFSGATAGDRLPDLPPDLEQALEQMHTLSKVEQDRLIDRLAAHYDAAQAAHVPSTYVPPVPAPPETWSGEQASEIRSAWDSWVRMAHCRHGARARQPLQERPTLPFDEQHRLERRLFDVYGASLGELRQQCDRYSLLAPLT